jgi:hypothetical protein
LYSAALAIASAQEASPKYKAIVPDTIRTPNNVETKTLGNLQFFDGMPSADTVAKTYDYLDVARAAETFLAGIPATSAYSVMGGFREAGMQPGDLGLAEELLDARSLPDPEYDNCLRDVGIRREGRTIRHGNPARRAWTGPGRVLPVCR